MHLSQDFSYMTLTAIQAALKAGDILRKGFGSSYQITAKPGRQNIVTQYDHASEESIISCIRNQFPTHSILGEESGLDIVSKDEILWIIDPLDGTTNFARHIPLFTISIAAYAGEEGLCGVIFQPITNELFVAQKGKGAYLNGVRLSVSLISNMEEALLGGGLPYDITEDPLPYFEPLSRLIGLGITLRNLGSAALGLAYVAAAKLDGFWMDYLHPWDLAAGKLLIEEAGGRVTRYNESPHKIKEPSNILATNALIHPTLLSYLNR